MKHHGFLSTSDKPHYENVPFEVPSSWVWCKLHDIIQITNGRSQKDVENVNGKYPIYGSGGIIGKAVEYLCEAGSTIIGRKGTINNPLFVEERFWNIDTAFGMKPMYAISDLYFFYFCQYFDFSKLDKSTAVPSLTQSAIGEVFIPIPPINEQKRITDGISYWLGFIDTLESNLINLQLSIKQTKSKILNLAIHGKLVPQDPTDEPAAELLKRINPKAEITCDNGHYQKLPEGWCETTLKHVLTIKSGNSINVRNCTQGHYPIYGGNGITGHTDDYNIKESTIVIGRVGYYCGSVYLVRGKAWVSDNAFITTIHKDIFYKKYLYYLLHFLNLRKFSNSTAQPVISGKTIYPIHVLIPPIREQKSIVAKIEEIFAPLNAIEASL